MNELVELITSSIENPIGDPWFPDLTSQLTTSAWDRLRRETGLTRASYGTERVLLRNPETSRDIISSLRLPEPDYPEIQIEGISEECASQYRQLGISFYSSQDTFDTDVIQCLEEALLVLSRVPTLMRTILALVRSIHLIKPRSPDHDVSFSEPSVPFSVFVSVPQERYATDVLRVAEAVVHEAMHLQLTLIEQHVPLANSTSNKYYSPWRNQYRNAQSILHAIYVFTSVAKALVEIRSSGRWAVEWTDHIQSRCSEITKQLLEVRAVQCIRELTPLGSSLVGWLMVTTGGLNVDDSRDY